MTQKEWDKLLIECFYIHPDATLYRIVGSGIEYPDERVADLKRCAKNKYQYNMSVSVFICQHLPRLAEILWRRTKNDIDVISKVLSKSNLDTTDLSCVEKGKLKNRRTVKGQDIRKHKAQISSMMLYRDTFDKSNGHNWGVVK